jgi:hypothetical protein
VAKGKAAYYCEFKFQLGSLLMLCEDSKLTWWVRVEAVTRVINTGEKKQPTIDIMLLLLSRLFVRVMRSLKSSPS